ncbi:MAG: GNAT family N-acetyltransferase [Candidatus Gracilibacteria bacterium]|nr:GNAT family N-acetyltransferase [Candidatus Gracilibacteria bacterium]
MTEKKNVNNDRVIILKGEKVALVVPEKSDLDLWYKGINNQEINKFLIIGNTIITREAQEKWYNEEANNETRKVLCIMSLETGNIIGNVGIHDIDNFHRIAEVGIIIFKSDEHSKGFGTESVKLITHYGFHRLNLRKIKIEYFGNNKGGEIAYKRVGFKEIGRYTKEYYANGKYEDRVMMEIFKEEFYEKYPEFLK